MFDLIIIGGGIIGCSIARNLSKYNLKIGLLEKNNDICTETTKANSAIIHAGYDNKPGTLKARLNVEGSQMFSNLSRELNFTYKKIGSLVLAFNKEDMMLLEKLYCQGLENEIENLEIISKSQVKELEPKISSKVIGALYAPGAGIVDPFNFSYAMAENAVLNGVDIRTKEEVVGIRSEDGDIYIETKNKTYRSKSVINAGGLYSDKIANMVGDYDFKILPTRGTYRVLRKDAFRDLDKILFQTPSAKGKGVLISPTYAGNTLLGPTSEYIHEDLMDDVETLDLLDRLGKKSIPDLDISKTLRVFTGVRAKADNGDFNIYRSKKLENCIHLGGIASPGLSSAPAIAKYVEDMVKEIFPHMTMKKNYKAGRTAINDADEGEEIICRCEQVTRSQIIDAINRPMGATTIGGVKRRIRPGMGFCQGNYCRPKVEEILKEELGKVHIDADERSGFQIVEDLKNNI